MNVRIKKKVKPNADEYEENQTSLGVNLFSGGNCKYFYDGSSVSNVRFFIDQAT